jgi:sulfonate transport system substrate-binding protein
MLSKDCARASRARWPAVCLAIAAGVGALPSAHAQLRVFGNTTTIELAPMLLAVKELYGESATVTNGGIPDLFDEDAADIATNAETQALRQSVDHPDLRIIFTVSEGFYRIVARRSAGIRELADLRGKRITTARNTSSHYYLHKMLGTVGGTVDDVTVVPMTLNLMPGALANREVDAVTIWEPEIERAAEMVGDDAIEFQDRRVYRELFNLNTTAANLANPAKRAEIVAFVRALIRASARIAEQPQEVWPLVAASTGYDMALIEKVWHHEGYPGTLVPDLLDVMVEEDVFVARERNRAPRTRAELAKLVDDSVLREALRD